jgi:hypothetical protein
MGDGGRASGVWRCVAVWHHFRVLSLCQLWWQVLWWAWHLLQAAAK